MLSLAVRTNTRWFMLSPGLCPHPRMLSMLTTGSSSSRLRHTSISSARKHTSTIISTSEKRRRLLSTVSRSRHEYGFLDTLRFHDHARTGWGRKSYLSYLSLLGRWRTLYAIPNSLHPRATLYQIARSLAMSSHVSSLGAMMTGTQTEPPRWCCRYRAEFER